MAAKKQVSVGETGRLGRIVASVPVDLLADMDEALAKFHRSEGKRTSVSAFIEVALREFIKRSDVTILLKRYGAVAKRIVVEK
jgi:hypothetical protein